MIVSIFYARFLNFYDLHNFYMAILYKTHNNYAECPE